jgi:hypothetical protein
MISFQAYKFYSEEKQQNACKSIPSTAFHIHMERFKFKSFAVAWLKKELSTAMHFNQWIGWLIEEKSLKMFKLSTIKK